MSPLRFRLFGDHSEVATQGNRRFVIHPMPVGKFLAKVYDREGKRQDFVASNVCETRAEAVKWLGAHRIRKEAKVS